MTLLNFLPSSLLQSAPTHSFGGDVLAEIYADFGLGLPECDPFGEFSNSLTDGLLSDPFDLSISPSFGVVNDSFYSVGGSLLFDERQDYLNDDLDGSVGRTTGKKKRGETALTHSSKENF